jgi:predicted secreted protein
MTIESSKYILAQIGQADSPETFVSIGAQSDGALSMDAQRIPTSNKTTSNWNTSIGGLRDFVITASGFADWPDTTGLAVLITQALAGNDFNARLLFEAGGDYFAGTVQATGLSLNGANQAATQWSTTWELSQGAATQTSP